MVHKFSQQELNKKELVILKNAVDESEKRKGRKNVSSPMVKNIMKIVEKFLKDNKFVCYGGTAINNLLPNAIQFYDKDIDMPDYDFFSPNALEDAKKLADIYYKKSFTEVEAKVGVHAGTYKVFVNFLPVADITQLDPKLYSALKKEAININGINYAPPNYLRMAAYLELSRPDGDTSRWEKVLRRLMLLNKNYPINEKKCNISSFIRAFETPNQDTDIIYKTVKNSSIDQGLVFFGGFALYSYGKYLSKHERKHPIKQPDFDVLSLDAEKSAQTIKSALEKQGIKHVTISMKPGIGEIIAPHYEVSVDGDAVIFIYTPLACHSYNTIKINGKHVKIATIDTMLSFYLAFLYADREYYDSHRILCIAQYLFHVQSKNRLSQKGVLKRFSINCYGKQHTLDDMKVEKADKFKQLRNKKYSREYQKYFLRYIPWEKHAYTTKLRKRKTSKKTRKKKLSKKSRKN